MPHRGDWAGSGEGILYHEDCPSSPSEPEGHHVALSIGWPVMMVNATDINAHTQFELTVVV